MHIVYKEELENSELLVKELYSFFTRDIMTPLERGLNIPLYIWKTGDLFSNLMEIISEKNFINIIFLFIDENMVLDDEYITFFNNLCVSNDYSKNLKLIPISVHSSSKNFFSTNLNINLVRFDKFDLIYKINKLKITLAFETIKIIDIIANNKNKDQPLKIFISHAKRDGSIFSEKFKSFLDTQTQIKSFYDITDIPPGIDFYEHIKSNINGNCLIAFQTDLYSTRSWCRRELIDAKKMFCPIILVSSLKKGEKRSFPYIGNAPSFIFTENINDSHFMLVEAAMKESLRLKYNSLNLNSLHIFDKFGSNTFLLPISPELLTVNNVLSDNKELKTIIYPEPPIGHEEIEVLNLLNDEIKFMTPIEFSSYSVKDKNIQNKKIGISISDSNDMYNKGLTKHHSKDLFIELCRYLIASDYEIVYGGDLRRDGYTQILFDLLNQYRTEINMQNKVVNYLSWPYYKSLLPKDEANLKRIANIRRVFPPDFLNYDEKNDYNKNNIEDRYILSQTLTRMRISMNDEIYCRILVGGATHNYAGRYPGLIEEAYLSIKQEKPVYLVGMFGGATKQVIDAIRKIPQEPIISNYHRDTTNLSEYLNMRIDDNALDSDLKSNISQVFDYFSNCGVAGLRNGLSNIKNEKLFNSVDFNEIISLILEGINNLNS